MNKCLRLFMIVYSGLKWVIVVYMFGITTISNNPKPHQTISNKKRGHFCPLSYVKNRIIMLIR